MAKYIFLLVLCMCIVINLRSVTAQNKEEFDCFKKDVCTCNHAHHVKECYDKLSAASKAIVAGVNGCNGNKLYEDPDAFFCKQGEDKALPCFQKITEEIAKLIAQGGADALGYQTCAKEVDHECKNEICNKD